MPGYESQVGTPGWWMISGGRRSLIAPAHVIRFCKKCLRFRLILRVEARACYRSELIKEKAAYNIGAR
jgi:hypothetical protein